MPASLATDAPLDSSSPLDNQEHADATSNLAGYRVPPEALQIASWLLAAAAIIATYFFTTASARIHLGASDPILIIGPSHAAAFVVSALLAKRWTHASSLIIVTGTVTGPWSAILQDLGDPFHVSFIFLSLVSIVAATLLLSWRWVIGFGVVNALGLGVLQILHPTPEGAALIATILAFLFTGLFATARWAWDKDRAGLARFSQTVEKALREVSESETRFKLLSDATKEAIIIHKDGWIRLCTPRMATMFGTPVDEIIGKDILSFIDATDQKALRTAIETKRLIPMRIMCRRRDGDRFPAEARGQPITYHGEDCGVLTLRDLTLELQAERDRKQVAIQQQKVADLEDTVATKARLMNMTSHELKNPLTPIRLQVAILRTRLEKIGSEQDHQCLNILERATERLGELVNDVTDVGRMEEGTLSVQREPMDLGQTINEEADVFQPVAENKNISFRVSTMPLPVLGDQRRLAQVISNVLSNALRFTDRSIRIEAREDAHEAVVEVTDDGVGIEAEKMGDLFQPFSQVHDPTLNVGGSGLGLYICRGIMEAHEGSIQIDSEGLGKGTTATIRLPMGTS